MLPEEYPCNKCGATKPLAMFRQVRGRRALKCKECQAAYARQHYAENPQRGRDIQKKYVAANSDKVKTRDEKYRKSHPEEVRAWRKNTYALNAEREKVNVKKWVSENIDRHKATLKRWNKANVEHVLEYRAANREKHGNKCKQWRLNHPEKVNEYNRKRRAMKAQSEGKLTHAEWITIIRQFKGRCVCCGDFHGFDGKGLEPDHIYKIGPLGSSGTENIQPLCTSCNIRKGDRHSTDYRKNPFTGTGQQRLFG